MTFAIGLLVVGRTGMSAVRTFVLPRAEPLLLTRTVFVVLRRIFVLRLARVSDYAVRDRVMAIYSPACLLTLAGTWVVLVGCGFAAMFWALDDVSVHDAVELSGSSLLTLGYARPTGLGGMALSFSEAGIGLGLVALLVSYLPSIYAAFTRREIAVSLIEPLAGTPPTPVVMLVRHQRIGALHHLDNVWSRWREWFADIEESHTSIAALVFFRSPRPDRSWLTAAGCVLDSAALTIACLDLPRNPNIDLCIRAGFVALRRIGDFFGISYDPDPQATDPISIGRDEFDRVWATLARNGLPMRSDVEQAWRDFAGWRVNYDTVLLALCGLTMAPPAPWSSDRSLPYRRPPMRTRGTGFGQM